MSWTGGLRRLLLKRRLEDRGETLLELTITIAVIGIGITSILGAVMIALHASTLDQRQVQAQARLKSWAEKLNTAAYADCATTTTYPSYATFTTQTPPLPALPSGFTATYGVVKSWNGTAFVDTSSSCVAGTTDTGVQLVDLRMNVADSLYPGFSTELWVTLRKPCSTSGAC
jgi:Tfp pilus assembly protein PilV